MRHKIRRSAHFPIWHYVEEGVNNSMEEFRGVGVWYNVHEMVWRPVWVSVETYVRKFVQREARKDVTVKRRGTRPDMKYGTLSIGPRG
jgi:hypothetical protein